MHPLCYNMAASATFQESQLSFSSRLLALWDRVPNRVGVVFWTGQCWSWTKTDSNKLAKVGQSVAAYRNQLERNQLEAVLK